MSSSVAVASLNLERWLQHRVAEVAGVAASSISLNTPLARLGVDSLGMLHLVETVEREVGTGIPGTICFDKVTVRSLAQALAGVMGNKARPSASLLEQMTADSELPDDIRPGTRGRPPGYRPQSIVLTGATGFLGAFLLRSLLRSTEAQIVLLVRPARDTPQIRVRNNLERYGIWDDRFEDRLVIFEADISHPRLGLGPSTFEGLANTVDAVFHAAAAVNWVYPYERLRNSNVLAVRELLRLACCSKTKPFHFISSLATCYSTSGPPRIAEPDNPAADIDGLHLGYAQTKCVAESLARTAADRGLPVSIFRPALVSGDSVSGISNTFDLVSSLIKGCIRMHAAPDLDWQLDLLPVDFAAEAIVQLALKSAGQSYRAFHLANPNLRHWRELILWMNLFGYPVDLIPYDVWLSRLIAGSRTGDTNPLRDLLPFFTHQPENQDGLYLPQLYEEPHRRKVHSGATRQALKDADLKCPRLSTALLDRYFAFFIDRQFLQPVETTASGSEGSARPLTELDARFFSAVFNSRVTNAMPLQFSGGHSVIGELTSWKYGSLIGVHAYHLEFAAPRPELEVIVKIKACDTEIKEVGQTLAALCSHDLGRAYNRYFDCLGFSGCHTRELEIYQQGDERFRRFTPTCYGLRSDDGRVALILEKLSGMEMMDSVDDVGAWQPEHIEAAIEGVAALHAIWYARAERLAKQTWLGTQAHRMRVLEAGDLWRALAENAQPMFKQWIGPEIGRIQQTLMAHLDEFRRLEELMPHTLIHNDFNPRNLAFRRIGGDLRLCLYDWELAMVGLPQHDLAELLCFVLPASVEPAGTFRYIEMHRAALERASGRQIDETSWALGFYLSLCDLMLNRLPAYAMVHRFQEQRFLERVIRTWKGLFDVVSRAIHTPL